MVSSAKEKRDGRAHRHHHSSSSSLRLSSSRSSDKGGSSVSYSQSPQQEAGTGSPTSVVVVVAPEEKEPRGAAAAVAAQRETRPWPATTTAGGSMDGATASAVAKTLSRDGRTRRASADTSLFCDCTGSVSTAERDNIDAGFSTDDDRYACASSKTVGEVGTHDAKIEIVANTTKFDNDGDDDDDDDGGGGGAFPVGIMRRKHPTSTASSSMYPIVEVPSDGNEVGCPSILCSNPVVDLMSNFIGYSSKEHAPTASVSRRTREVDDQQSTCTGSVNTSLTVIVQDDLWPSSTETCTVEPKANKTQHKHNNSSNNTHPMVNVDMNDENDGTCMENSLVWSLSNMCAASKESNSAMMLEDNVANKDGRNGERDEGDESSRSDRLETTDETTTTLAAADSSRYYYCATRKSRIRSRNRVSIFNAPSKYYQDLRYGTTFDYPLNSVDVVQTTKSMGDDFREEEFSGDFEKNGQPDLPLTYFMNTLGIDTASCTNMVGACIPFSGGRQAITTGGGGGGGGSQTTVAKKRSFRRQTSGNVSSIGEKMLVTSHHHDHGGSTNNAAVANGRYDVCVPDFHVTEDHNAPGDANDFADVFYDSDPQHVRFRHRRPRRAIEGGVDVVGLASSESPHDQGHVRTRKSQHVHRFSIYRNSTENNVDLSDELQLDLFVEEMKHTKMDLIWHPSQFAENNNRPLRIMRSRAWIEMGSVLCNHIVHPKFMWKSAYEPNLLHKKINVVSPHSIDLLDIIGIVPLQQQEFNRSLEDGTGMGRHFASVDRNEHPFAHPWASFKITTVNDRYYLFEAEDRVARDRIVLGLKLIVARLASKVLVAGEVAEEEFFSPGGGRQVYDAWWADDGEEDDDDEEDDEDDDDFETHRSGVVYDDDNDVVEIDSDDGST